MSWIVQELFKWLAELQNEVGGCSCMEVYAFKWCVSNGYPAMNNVVMAMWTNNARVTFHCPSFKPKLRHLDDAYKWYFHLLSEILKFLGSPLQTNYLGEHLYAFLNLWQGYIIRIWQGNSIHDFYPSNLSGKEYFVLKEWRTKRGGGKVPQKKGRVQKRKDLINEACREGPAPIATQIDIQMANLEIGTSSWFDIICSGVIPFRKYSNINLTNWPNKLPTN